jgi:hypothetical protein
VRVTWLVKSLGLNFVEFFEVAIVFNFSLDFYLKAVAALDLV